VHFSHIGLSCKDTKIIEKYYTKHFGFRRTRVFYPGPQQIVMLKSEGLYLELFPALEESPVPAPKETGPSYPGWRHICFAVDDLYKKLEEMGDEVVITLGPKDMNHVIPGMKVCWIADPEGNIIELNQGYRDEVNPPTPKG
jgi:glyoxylase I family protein